MYAYHPTEDPMIEVTGRPMETLPVQEFLSDPKTYLNEVQFRNGAYELTGRPGSSIIGYLLADFPVPDANVAGTPIGTRTFDRVEGAGA